MKQTLVWFNLQRSGTENGLPNIKDTFAESLQLQMSVLHQSMSKTLGITLKNMAFPEGNKLCAGGFRVNLDETRWE